MKGVLRSFTWTDKPTLPKEAALAVAVVVACLIAYFKLRQSGDAPTVVSVAPYRIESASTPESIQSGLKPVELGVRRSPQKTGTQGISPMGNAGKAVIERPLFDGLPVSTQAILRTSISSHLPGTVEAVITGFRLDSTSSEVDTGRAEGAKLRGTAAFNLAAKRVSISFTELISREGRSYPVVGTAIDPETQAPGVEADYSSGLPARLLGVAIDRAITAADQIAMAKLFEGSMDGSPTARELQRASIETNQQAAMNLSSEATKDLRETGPELSLAAGAPLIIELRAAETGESP